MKSSAPLIIVVGALAVSEIFGNHQSTPTTAPAPIVPAFTIPAPITNGRQMVIPANNYNQCYLEAFANGKKFRFLLDSGASEVSFGIKLAPQLGFDPTKLDYDEKVVTANGNIRTADVRLNEFRIKDYVLNNFKAHIDDTKEGTQNETPLLGSSVLKLVDFQVRNGACVLTLPEETAKKPSKPRSISRHSQRSQDFN